MPNHNRKGRSKKGPQFMMILYVMAHSRAWRSLSGPAIKVYVELRSRFDGRNNGELSLSYREAAILLGIGRSSAGRAFAELQEKGFIIKTSSGSWYGRKAATYAVTDQALDGHPATNDWMNWHKSGALKKKQKSVPVRDATRLCVPDRRRKRQSRPSCVPGGDPSNGVAPRRRVPRRDAYKVYSHSGLKKCLRRKRSGK